MTDKRKTLNDASPKEWDQASEQYKNNCKWALTLENEVVQVANQAMASTLANPEDNPGIKNIDGAYELTYNTSELCDKDWNTFFDSTLELTEDFNPRDEVPYKFNEGPLIAEFKEYIDSTYNGHYSKNKFQSTEFIIDCDHGLGFTLGNVLKYTQRYGKKEGHNRKDLLKILHYALIALSIHDDNFEK